MYIYFFTLFHGYLGCIHFIFVKKKSPKYQVIRVRFFPCTLQINYMIYIYMYIDSLFLYEKNTNQIHIHKQSTYYNIFLILINDQSNINNITSLLQNIKKGTFQRKFFKNETKKKKNWHVFT